MVFLNISSIIACSKIKTLLAAKIFNRALKSKYYKVHIKIATQVFVPTAS